MAVRMLEQRRIPCEVFEFDPAVRDAAGVADAVGVDPRVVYKTLVVEPVPAGKPMLVMVAADREIDLKRLAAATGNKRVRMASHVDAETLTGLAVGGISALALVGRGFQVFIDADACREERLLVSGGRRGCDVGLRVADLISVTGARPVAVSKGPPRQAG